MGRGGVNQEGSLPAERGIGGASKACPPDGIGSHPEGGDEGAKGPEAKGRGANEECALAYVIMGLAKETERGERGAEGRVEGPEGGGEKMSAGAPPAAPAGGAGGTLPNGTAGATPSGLPASYPGSLGAKGSGGGMGSLSEGSVEGSTVWGPWGDRAPPPKGAAGRPSAARDASKAACALCCASGGLRAASAAADMAAAAAAAAKAACGGVGSTIAKALSTTAVGLTDWSHGPNISPAAGGTSTERTARWMDWSGVATTRRRGREASRALAGGGPRPPDANLSYWQAMVAVRQKNLLMCSTGRTADAQTAMG